MSVKTCQLCGKPLGRMRGADGEFCSREHRNQFRMRQGLDRLEEANKVASLMRRRENLKPIPTTQLAAGTAAESRAVVTPAQYPTRTPEDGFPHLNPLLFEVRVAEVPERYRRPITRWSQGPSGTAKVVGPHWLPLSKQTRTSPVFGTLQAAQPRTGVAQAQLVQVRRAVPAAQESLRECGAALQVARKPRVPSAGFTLETPGAKRLEKARGFQKIPETAVAEIPSESQAAPRFEFERQKPALRPRPRKPGASGGLKQPQISGLSKPEAIEGSSEFRWCGGPRLESPMRLPKFRVKQQAAAASRGEIIRLQPAGYDSALQQPRWCNGVREIPSVASVGLQSVPFRGRGFMTADALRMTMARDSANDWRTAQVRFEPEDTAFEASLPLQGSLGPAGEGDGGASKPIEEHFNEGLGQWSGDTLEWRLDAAGARPAGLALLRPTLELSDYEFEFFTRIESQAVTFVFRASNVSNYLKVTIAMVESGRYELRRCAVIGGIEEAAVASPLPGVIRPGSAFTVKTRASQNDFTIWLDGELAAKWKDGRLPTGGIGFMAPRNDRARVYWVRLSQADGNSKAATVRPIRSIQ